MTYEKTYYTAKEISEILGVSQRFAYELMDKPDFPLIRLGKAKGAKRVNKTSFYKWLENQTKNKEIYHHDEQLEKLES